MPILAEKINPPKFIQTTFHYNMQVLGEYFGALKGLVQLRKNFIRSKRLQRTEVVFRAFLQVVNKQHLMRFTANKIRHQRVKEYLSKSFGYLKKYSRTKKLLRIAEAQFNIKKSQKILRQYFAVFERRVVEVRKEKLQYQ